MTKEAIDTARLRLQRVAALAVNAEEAKVAFDDIDALYAARREPEGDLVGRKVRFSDQVGIVDRIECHWEYIVKFHDGPEMYLERDEFELLEDDNG